MDTNVRILNEVAANFLLELLGNETCLTGKKEVTRKDQCYLSFNNRKNRVKLTYRITS